MAVPRVPVRRSALLPAAVLCVLLTACAAGAGNRADGTSASVTTTGPTSSQAAPPSTEEQRVDAALAGLDRREQVAQLFVIGVRLDDLGSGDALVDAGVGGLFLAGRSQTPAEDLRAVTEGWQSAAPGPALWVAVDQEGGAVQTLSGEGFERLPTAQEQGRLPAGELTALAADLGTSLDAAGINLDLAPVADVVPAGTEAGNAPIGAYGRQYGSTPEEVVAAAGTIVAGLADAGVTATLKHFPGLGRVTGNTDDTAVVHDGVTTADDPQLAVFTTLADSPAAPFVMASSAIYDRIDPSTQAMFSPVVLTDVLREQLGFDGVVISDDLGNAEAVSNVAVGDRAVRFLAAGGTLVLSLQPSDLEPMVEAVLARANADPEFAAVVDDAVRTALLAKARAGLL
ncbi:glycoside hydrolase family 3 protein [Blastococcus jejuensis]|uniref:beta-N-acetylhexosaminidase n=1 Tax=Blastococcus jejuensis TaxID=351224 RepID=A0ABP6NZ08_9ACTN